MVKKKDPRGISNISFSPVIEHLILPGVFEFKFTIRASSNEEAYLFLRNYLNDNPNLPIQS